MDPISNLQRFVDAQRDTYADALDELRGGRKQSHWMWFVLPQLRGLGRSPMAECYGLDGAAEAAAYLAHPLLGPRLLECVRAMLAHQGHEAAEVLGSIDALKFRSCLTLFAAVAPEVPEFSAALRQFYAGQPDAATLRLLAPT